MNRNIRRKSGRRVVEYEVTYPRDASNRNQIADEIARAITSKYNQHITLLIVGQPGSGKSWASIDLAYQAAYAVSRIIDGKNAPHEMWWKYFNLDHMAIVTLDRVTNLLKHIRRYGIYILDDIGVGYNARDWQKSKNRKMNEIIQTFRTDNTCVIYTVPDRFLIDKVPRSLVERYMEFEKGEQVFSKQTGKMESVNVFRYFNITSLKRNNKQLFTYMVDYATSGDQFARHIAVKPPNRLILQYDVIRADVATELRITNARLIEEGESTDSEPDNNRRVPQVSATVQHERELTVQQVVFVDQLRADGKTIPQACLMAGIEKRKYNSLSSGDTKWYNEWNNNN